MRTRILLINAPTQKTKSVGLDNYFPMGLLYLGSLAKSNNMDVSIVDINNHYYMKDVNDDILCEYVENNLLDYVRDYKPDIVGIGCTFSGAFKSLKLIAKKIKEKHSNIPIVIGGIHATVFAQEILKKYDYVDYIVMGEGERSFVEIVNCITMGNPSLDTIDGIAFRKDGVIRLNPKSKFINDLDQLPLPDYTLINSSKYNIDTTKWYSPRKLEIGQPFTVISSRSCPNCCTFCSMWLVHGSKIRFRSAENVLNEMEKLYNERNVRYFQFMDDNITFDKKRILDICNGIQKRKIVIQFDTPNGLAINRLDEEIISAMVDTGLVCTSLGIESGSEFIRNRVMKKGLSTKKIYDAVAACAKHLQLFIKGFFIIGMPEETHETLQDTYDMIKKLPLDKISVNFVAAYPGTKLFSYCAKNNLLRYSLEDYVGVEIFQDSDDVPHFKPYNLEIGDLIEFRQKCFDYMKNKRSSCNVPANYPLRYRDGAN